MHTYPHAAAERFAPIEITFKMWYHLGKAILGGLKKCCIL